MKEFLESEEDGIRVLLRGTFIIPHKEFDFLPDEEEWAPDFTTTKSGSVIFNNFGVMQDLKGNDIAYWKIKDDGCVLYYMTDFPDKEKSNKAFEMIKGMSDAASELDGKEYVMLDVRTETFPHLIKKGIIKGEQK